MKQVNRKKAIGLASIIFIFALLCGGGVIYWRIYSANSPNGNKSLPRADRYKDQYRGKGDERIAHFSIDDVIDIFYDITNQEYDSIFENSTLAWLKELHNEYGIVVSCYVFYESTDFSLSECTEKFRCEFTQNADWLRFGFHSYNGQTSYGDSTAEEIIRDYNLTINCLLRVVGEEAIDHVIRLQNYKGSKAAIDALAANNLEPIVALLTADDARQSYYLNNENSQYIYCHDKFLDDENEMVFYSTDIRIEYMEDVEQKINEFSSASWNNQLMYFLFFTHEWALEDSSVLNDTKTICEWAASNGYTFKFLEDCN